MLVTGTVSLQECKVIRYFFAKYPVDKNRKKGIVETSREQWIEYRFTQGIGSSPVLVEDDNGVSCENRISF